MKKTGDVKVRVSGRPVRVTDTWELKGRLFASQTENEVRVAFKGKGEHWRGFILHLDSDGKCEPAKERLTTTKKARDWAHDFQIARSLRQARSTFREI